MLNNSQMKSVFDDADEKDFDTMFGAEEDNELMEAVCGFDEDGNSILDADEDELHNNGDECDPKDIADSQGPDNDSKNKPTDDSVGKNTTDDEGNYLKFSGKSDADKAYKDNEKDYQDGKDNKGEVDPENIEDGSDKAFDQALKEIMEEAEETFKNCTEEEKASCKECDDVDAGEVGSDEVEDLTKDLEDDEDDDDHDQDSEGSNPIDDLSDDDDESSDDDLEDDLDEMCRMLEMSEDPDDDDLVDAVDGDDSEPTSGLDSKLAYDSEDEELIDMVEGK